MVSKHYFNVVTIYRNKKYDKFIPYFSVTNFFQKVKREMDFGHF
jgi:hypothetical protein